MISTPPRRKPYIGVMEYDIERINRMFKSITPRKVVILSKLAGLNDEEIRIMNLQWVEGRSDIQICDTIGCSTATLTRRRRVCYTKILDAMGLYGLGDMDSLPVLETLVGDGMFCKAQENLVQCFVRNRDNETNRKVVVGLLDSLKEVLK